jgi:hypothetical protein
MDCGYSLGSVDRGSWLVVDEPTKSDKIQRINKKGRVRVCIVGAQRNSLTQRGKETTQPTKLATSQVQPTSRPVEIVEIVWSRFEIALTLFTE